MKEYSDNKIKSLVFGNTIQQNENFLKIKDTEVCELCNRTYKQHVGAHFLFKSI